MHSTKKLYDKIQKDILYDLYYNKKLSFRNIANELQCTWFVVSRAMKFHGLEPRKSTDFVKSIKGKSFVETYGEERAKELSNIYSNSRKGMKLSDEHKINISISKSGVNNFNYGKKFSEEYKNKISESHKNKPHPWSRGELNVFWKGGITPVNKSIRMSMKFRIWRESVFKRDDWSCIKCGIRSGKGLKVFLHPHHIFNFSEYKDLRFLIDNGVTFCEDCHVNFHNFYGRKNNNLDQIIEFLEEN
jgi:hypothetical protein